MFFNSKRILQKKLPLGKKKEKDPSGMLSSKKYKIFSNCIFICI
jgi:hypothetical protein